MDHLADWVFVPFHRGLRLNGMGEISSCKQGDVRATIGRFAEGKLASSRAALPEGGGSEKKVNVEEMGSGAVEDKRNTRGPPMPCRMAPRLSAGSGFGDRPLITNGEQRWRARSRAAAISWHSM
jgi:hypothetical protein